MRAAEFPHKEIAGLLITHCIIQDANLMQIFTHNTFVQVIAGLSQETGKSVAELIASQKDFLYNITWNTTWARQVLKQKYSIPSRI